MTPPPAIPEAVQGLIKQWRDTADVVHSPSEDQLIAHTLRACADELEARLQACSAVSIQAWSAARDREQGLVEKWQKERRRVADAGLAHAGKKRGYEAAGICAGYEACISELDAALRRVQEGEK